MSLQKVGRRKADPDGNEIEPKERITQCALGLFQEKGYAGVSIRDIIGAAGVTQATLYYHFGDKKGLYRVILVKVLEDILLEIMKISPVSPFEDQLIHLLTIFYHYRRLSVGTMLYEMTTHEDFEVKDLQKVGAIVNQGWRPAVEKMVREGMRRGEVRRRNVTFYTQLIFEMGFSFARSPLGNWTGWDEERQISELASLLVNGMGSEQGSSSI